MENILVTGGCGFIGSHVVLGLLERGFSVIVLDSNVNSKNSVIENIRKILISKGTFSNLSLHFIRGDIRDENLLEKIFEDYSKKGARISSVIHLAGLKSIKDSFENPFDYWDNNVLGSLSLLKTMIKFKCFNFVFSSSATVYGNPKSIPIFEEDQKNPINPYGQTKLAVENILNNLYQRYKKDLNIMILRYFNPIGAHNSGLIGENIKNGSDNIFPSILEVALNKKNYLKVFGNNWPTSDGTTVRDFIHVMDLAEAHILTLIFLKSKKSYMRVLNIGTGSPFSILELIKTFENSNKIDIPYKYFARRSGDTPVLLANCDLAKKTLNWEAKRNLSDMCKDGWNFAKQKYSNF